MSSFKYGGNISIIRNIQHELGHILKQSKSKDSNTSNNASMKHILNLVRENQVTERRFCRPKDHYKYFAQTYLTYLRSSRMEEELVKKYFNKGERSIESSARLVGLELPKVK